MNQLFLDLIFLVSLFIHVVAGFVLASRLEYSCNSTVRSLAIAPALASILALIFLVRSPAFVNMSEVILTSIWSIVYAAAVYARVDQYLNVCSLKTVEDNS